MEYSNQDGYPTRQGYFRRPSKPTAVLDSHSRCDTDPRRGSTHVHICRRHGPKAQSCETLQDNFHRLAKWAGENDLQLNEEKIVHMTFHRGGRPVTNERTTFNDRPLTKVNSFKYLGVTLQCYKDYDVELYRNIS
jgi:hypothetical protein